VLRVVAVRDLTARRQAAAQSESLVRELEARNVELERFGFAVAHDLKAPLVTAKGFADHLERDASGGRSDRIVADARRIREAVDRVQRLVEELAEFSGAGRPVGPPVAVATEALVREGLRLLAGRFEAAGVRLELATPLPVVYGDRARLVRVFCRLLEEAAASPGARDTVLRVEARPAQDGKAVLVVRRTGTRIDPRDYDRLLGVEPADTRHEGARVGLSLVKRVLESHGGRVWVEYEADGPHVLLCFTLPLPPEGAREAGPAREGPARPAE
jgi:signal transduction histidine kinase